jgi:DNA-binding transcriptional MerR regulator
MSKQILQRRNEPASAIPDKLYFRIGEVAKLCGVEAYVLRFWESEFPPFRPNKSGTGQRLYRRRDVEVALRIKRLLYSDGYTIAGARQVFAAEMRQPKKSSQAELPLQSSRDAKAAEVRLNKLRGELREILGILSTPGKSGQMAKSERPAKREQTEKPRGSTRGGELFES